jgi:DNA repair exonuclease SbcCD ATPase subunit
MRTKLLWAALLVSLVVSCDSDKEKAKIAEIQKQADDRIAQAQKEAQEKVAAAEKRLEQLQTDMADAGAAVKAEADEKVAEAKSEADKLAAQAADALAKARTAYKDSAHKQLTPVFKELDEIHAKEGAAQPKIKAQVDAALKTISTKRDAVKKEIDAFDGATLETLKTVKAKADQGIAELKALVHGTRTKLP